MKQPSNKDIDRLSELAVEIMWYWERGTDPREIARILSKKHRTELQPMLQFITQLRLMAERVMRGDSSNIRMH